MLRKLNVLNAIRIGLIGAAMLIMLIPVPKPSQKTIDQFDYAKSFLAQFRQQLQEIKLCIIDDCPVLEKQQPLIQNLLKLDVIARDNVITALPLDKKAAISSINPRLTPLSSDDFRAIDQFIQHISNELVDRSIQWVLEQEAFEKNQRNLLFICLIGFFLISLTKNSVTQSNFKRKEGEAQQALNDLRINIDKLLQAKPLDAGMTVDTQDRQIYAKIEALQANNQKLHQQSDMMHQLYSLIGFEIRSITNNIKGGLNYLLQDGDDEALLISRDITQSAQTLSELAQNYNRLLSKGNQQSNIRLESVLNELLIHLSSKLKHFEYHIPLSLPDTIQGESTGIFWALYLQLSQAISKNKDSYLYLTVNTTLADESDHVLLNINAIFLPNFNVSPYKLISLHWQENESGKDNISQLITSFLPPDFNYDAKWYQSGRAVKLSINMQVLVNKFNSISHGLNGKNIAILMDNPLKEAEITSMLNQCGANIKSYQDSRELLNKLDAYKHLDAIFISDRLDGVDIINLARVIKTKSPAMKLFLLVHDSSIVAKVHPHVNQLFYAPIMPSEMIKVFHDVLMDEKQQDTLDALPMLVVEDDKVQQFILKKTLNNNNFTVECVNDGLEALAWLKQNRASLIFMDCIMPNLDGFDATKAIRKQEQSGELAVRHTIIGATALTSIHEHQLCLDVGMDYVISKPYKNDEIVKVIKKYVALQKIH